MKERIELRPPEFTDSIDSGFGTDVDLRSSAGKVSGEIIMAGIGQLGGSLENLFQILIEIINQNCFMPPLTNVSYLTLQVGVDFQEVIGYLHSFSPSNTRLYIKTDFQVKSFLRCIQSMLNLKKYLLRRH